MAWDFSTDPEFEAQLEWIREFRNEQIAPLDLLYPKLPYYPLEGDLGVYVRSLQRAGQGARSVGRAPRPGARRPGLRSAQAGADQRDPRRLELGAERVRHAGARHRQRRDHRPLRHRRAEGDVPPAAARTARCFSCFSMTEPHAGADPKMFTTGPSRTATSGSSTGEKYFSSNARTSKFVIVMASTNPDASAYQGMSMFLVPSDTPGIEIVRHIGMFSASTRTRACTPSSATTTSASRRRTCSAARARASTSRRPASAAAASTTRCGPSACAAGPST